MSKVKIYEAYAYRTVVPGQAIDMLDEPGHIRQGTVYLASTSKTRAAHHLARTLGGYYTTAAVGEGMGNFVDALLNAGFLAEDGEVYVSTLQCRNGDKVLRAVGDCRFELIGTLSRDRNTHVLSLLPVLEG